MRSIISRFICRIFGRAVASPYAYSMKMFLAGIALVLLVSACTTGGSDAPANNEPVPTREGVDAGSGSIEGDVFDGSGFFAVLEGAESLVVEDEGTINCENGGYVIRPAINTFPQISLILPVNSGAGNYPLVNNSGDGSVATATVFFNDGRVFASAIDGILIVNSLASSAGQVVSGTFDFSGSSAIIRGS